MLQGKCLSLIFASLCFQSPINPVTKHIQGTNNFIADKISRLKNLLSNGKNYVKGEGMEDTFIDIANYGIIGLLVGRDKWKK